MKKEIHIHSKKVPDIQALFSLFEEELGSTFGRNLDGLADILSDEDDLHIILHDRDVFEDIFSDEATEEYFGERYREGMSTLAETLLEIFEETATLEFKVFPE